MGQQPHAQEDTECCEGPKGHSQPAARDAPDKEARAEALKRARLGQHIPGYKVIHAPTKRKWVKDALDQFGHMRLKKDIYLTESLKSPKQVLESDIFKNLSEPRRAKIEALVEKPIGALRLVTESTPGEPVAIAATEVFKSVPPPLPPAL